MSAQEEKNFSVTIVDGKIILSLPEACEPVVWQMDLERAQSAAFTVKEKKKEKRFALVLKSDDGEAEDIAEFDDKKSAVAVLMETSSVMQNAHGLIKGAGATAPSGVGAQAQPSVVASSAKSGGSDKAGAVLAVILVVILLGIWAISASIPSKVGSVGSTAASSSSSSNFVSAPTPARESSGVPVSADDFLSNR